MAQLIYKNWRKGKQTIDFPGLSLAMKKINKEFPVSSDKVLDKTSGI